MIDCLSQLTNSDWVSIITVLVLFGTFLVAILQIIESNNITRKNNAIQLMMSMKKDEILDGVFLLIKKIHDDDELQVQHFVTNGISDDKAAKEQIKYLLNYYETIAVGIKQKIYDENIVMESRKTTMMQTFIVTRPYIEKVREDNGSKTTYEHYQNLIEKWQKNDEKKPILFGLIKT